MFTADAVPGLADGTITVTFRAWKRPQAKVGGRFHKDDLWFEVDAVRTALARISKADARRAGEADADAVRRRLGDPPPETEVYRWLPQDRSRRAARERGRPGSRRDRRDHPPGPSRRAAVAGPWTRATLALIATQPGVVSMTLAETLGRERFALKTDIRKAEAPRPHPEPGGGLRAARRGQAYLDATS